MQVEESTDRESYDSNKLQAICDSSDKDLPSVEPSGEYVLASFAEKKNLYYVALSNSWMMQPENVKANS